MLQIEKLTVSYEGNKAVDHVSFNVKEGEFFGILGPNGSGKSSILKAISGLIPFDGSVLLNGQQLTHLKSKERARKISFLSQHIDLSFSFTVLDVILMGRYPYQSSWIRGNSREDMQLAEMVMKETGISHLKDRDLHYLSGGELQRVFLARALIQEPDLLLLDEPTNHLDMTHQLRLLEYIHDLTRKKKVAVIAIFHDINLASLFCDRLLILNQGNLIDVGKPSAILTEDRIAKVYTHSLATISHPFISRPMVVYNLNKKDAFEALVLHSEKKNDHYIVHFNKPLKCLTPGNHNTMFEWRDMLGFEDLGNKEVLCQKLVYEEGCPIYLYVFKNKDIIEAVWVFYDNYLDEPNMFAIYESLLLECYKNNGLDSKKPDIAIGCPQKVSNIAVPPIKSIIEKVIQHIHAGY